MRSSQSSIVTSARFARRVFKNLNSLVVCGKPATLGWFVRAVCFALAISVAFEAQAQTSPKRLKVLIVTGFDVSVHKWRATTPAIRSILEETGRFDVNVSESVEAFESSSLGNYDAIVLNYGFWKQPDPSEQGKAGLLNYVKSGKGLVSLHFACSAFQDWAEYCELLGRVWKKGVAGHGPRGKFTVHIKVANHPITAGLSDFEIDDELYSKLSGDAEIQVLASAHSDWSQHDEPIVFVRRYGKGRVVQNVLGHDTRVQKNASYQTLLRRSVEWAATGHVTVK